MKSNLEDQQQSDTQKQYNQKMVSKYKDLVNDSTLILFNDKHIQSLSFVSQLEVTTLRILDFRQEQLIDVPKQLEQLCIVSNFLKNIDSIKEITNLQYLNLLCMQIDSITAICNQTSLKELYLSNNKISDIGLLGNLVNLNKLQISVAQIKQITSVQYLVNLVELELSGNAISDISPLSSLGGLHTLDLGDNQISDISSLRHLTELRILSLHSNQIIDIYSKQQVEFKVSHSDYVLIIEKRAAIFELRYDISYVIVNSSVAIVEHTKYNGTGCFSSIAMKYSMYGDIDILTNPNNCQVDFSAGVSITFDYTVGSQNKQIPIYSCNSGCSEGEYNSTTTNFQDIMKYRVKKTNVLSSKFTDFYTAFVANRLIKISLNIKFNTNGVQTTITQFIDNKTALDSWGCVNDISTPTYFGLDLITKANPEGIFMQVRGSKRNQLLCNTSPASKVNIDLYMMQGISTFRQQKQMDMHIFNESVGVSFDNNEKYQQFRDNIFVMGQTQALMILSFVDSNNIIINEICMYQMADIGCIKQQDIKIYNQQICADIKFETRADCKLRNIPQGTINRVALYFIESGSLQLLGTYNFPEQINYSTGNLTHCFTCDSFDPTFSSAAGSCAKNWALTKQKIKLSSNAKVGLIYINKFDNYNAQNVIAQYNSAWTLFIVVSSLLVLLVVITIIVLVKTQI
ncbi:Conserved_hypothetical protein [Hexamita inflata]|uniref:Uncharacterized protein n=1 Tax=Hexamita inflata TaxID=28002 RepID=A0AA86PEX4_9EUKA|nr:Conserved hypothetical protein [Hexamita inflata]